MAKKSKYYKEQLEKGTEIEREDRHTKNPYFQEKIANDHLQENKDYYKYSGGKGKEYLVSSYKKDIYCENEN